MILTVDVGNTNTEFVLWSEGKKKSFCKNSTHKKKTTAAFADLFSVLRITAEKIEAVLISSVVPEADLALKQFFKKQGLSTVFASCQNIPLNIKYKPKENVGADRLCASYAASVMYPKKNIIVVDFGTAITFDVVSATKDYLGGLIFPGLTTAKNALVEKASLLPDIELKKAYKVIGTSTEKSMLSGIYYGTIAMVKGVIEKIKRELKIQKITVIATGGDAVFMRRAIEDANFIVPDLVHRGLLYLREEIQ